MSSDISKPCKIYYNAKCTLQIIDYTSDKIIMIYDLITSDLLKTFKYDILRIETIINNLNNDNYEDVIYVFLLSCPDRKYVYINDNIIQFTLYTHKSEIYLNDYLLKFVSYKENNMIRSIIIGRYNIYLLDENVYINKEILEHKFTNFKFYFNSYEPKPKIKNEYDTNVNINNKSTLEKNEYWAYYYDINNKNSETLQYWKQIYFI